MGSPKFGVLSHHHVCRTDYSEGLLCFYKDQELLYPEDPPSSFIVSTKAVADDDGIQVYPSPFTDRLYIEGERWQFASSRLYDLTGRLIQEGYLAHGQGQIDLADVHAGSYHLALHHPDGRTHTRMVLKH